METKCPHCQTVQAAPDTADGRKARCKNCRQVFLIEATGQGILNCQGEQATPHPATLLADSQNALQPRVRIPLRIKLQLSALWCAVIVLAALQIAHQFDRELTVRRLAVVNHLGQERIVLRTLGPEGAYLDLSDGSDDNDYRVQLYSVGSTYSAGMSVTNGLGAAYRYGGIEMITSPFTSAQLHTIGRDGSSMTIAPPAATKHPPDTFPDMYLDTIHLVFEANRTFNNQK